MTPPLPAALAITLVATSLIMVLEPHLKRYADRVIAELELTFSDLQAIWEQMDG